MSFATKLNQLRVAKRMSLQQVGDAVGISKAHVWNLEKRKAENPSMDLVVKLADLFQVRVADLVGENPDGEGEDPEIVAMFRDLKKLEKDDRDTIRLLMEEFKRRSAERE